MKRWIAMVTTAVMFCTLLSGCGGQEEGPGESKEGGAKDTLTVAANGEPTKIDPQSNDEATNHKVAIQMFEPLFIVNSQGEIEGLLAEDWEYQDEKTLTIHLRQGVKFHNGEELKASDVLFTMERANRINPSIAAIVNMIDVENSTADDEYTVTLRLLQPYASRCAICRTQAPASSAKKLWRRLARKILPTSLWEAQAPSSLRAGIRVTALLSSALRTIGAKSPPSPPLCSATSRRAPIAPSSWRQGRWISPMRCR